MSNLGYIKVDIPLLGMTTYAKDVNDINSAIAEALICFAYAAEKYGKGLNQELMECVKNLKL